MKRAIILGGGFSGFTWAHLLAKRGWEAVVLEKTDQAGGGIKTLWYNGHPYTHGPRHFVGKSRCAFEFIDALVPQRELTFSARTYVGQDDQFYTYTPHLDDVERMPDKEKIRVELKEAEEGRTGSPVNFEDKWIKGIGETLYRKFAEKYTRKHWQIPTTAIIDEHNYTGLQASFAELRTGTHRYLDGHIVAYPRSMRGWDDYFSRLAENRSISVRYNAAITAYDLEKRAVWIGGEKIQGDLVVSTLSPDTVFDYAHGRLPYAGRTVTPLVLPVPRAFPDDVIFMYYAGDEPYLRIVEYKKFTGYSSPNTLLGIEYPASGAQDYPYPIHSEIERAKRYREALPKGVISVGRLGSYRYMTISDIIDQALELVEEY